MTLAALQAGVWSRLNDDGTFYQPDDVTAALNEAQRLFVLLTLCLEASVPFALQPGVSVYRMLSLFPDYLLPRRLSKGSVQLAPSSIAELDAIDSTWLAFPGIPLRIAQAGLDLLLVTPQPVSVDNWTLVYARTPLALVVPSDVPEIRIASHEALADMAACVLRIPEGAQELSKFASYESAFMEEVAVVAELVRARSIDAGYDRVPAELTTLADKSRGKRK